MQFKKTPIKELVVGIALSIKDSIQALKKQCKALGRALYRLIETLFFMLLRIVTLLLIPVLFPLVQHLIYKYKISNLRSWNKKFQREWRYQKRRSRGGMYGHPYSEIIDLIHQNKDFFNPIVNEEKNNKKGIKS